MAALFEALPSWLGWAGWAITLVGVLMLNRATVRMQASIKNSVRGNHNHITNVVEQQSNAPSGEDSNRLLSVCGSVASILGLVLGLMSLLKAS